jgi:hypothetical protein
MITEIEARRRNLPGCDTFKRTELTYKDDINRDSFVIKLNIESYKVFCSSFLIGDYPKIIKEREHQEIYYRKLNENIPETNNLTIIHPPIIQERFEFINLENFYLATGFELSFKSKLLHRNFIVNIFEDSEQFANLRKEQKKRPVNKTELFSISGYFYDEVNMINSLKGITGKSLDFSIILNKPKYQKELLVDKETIQIAEEFRNLRNQIHLPGDWKSSALINKLGDSLVSKLVDYINHHIVDMTNQLIDMYDFNSPKLQRLNYYDNKICN